MKIFSTFASLKHKKQKTYERHYFFNQNRPWLGGEKPEGRTGGNCLRGMADVEVRGLLLRILRLRMVDVRSR